jgi:integrase
MPKSRTGTLLPPGVDGIWRARVTKTNADGSTTRPLYSLGTTDKSLARRKLARLVSLVESGADLLDAAEASNAPERVKDYADAWLAKREAQGIVMAADERRNVERHVLPEIGHLPLCDVRPSHVRAILEGVAASTYTKGIRQPSDKPYRRETVTKVRGAMHRLFRAAQEDDLIEHNPVAPVRTPKTREVKKERAILTDDEFSRFVACPAVDLELRMLSLVARCEGGMRTGDLHKWDWTMIDRLHFEQCTIPRSKSGAPQVLAIPPALAPFLRAWWERADEPESGPVFPARAGKRVGQQKRPENSYAKRLRNALFRAGIVRMPPVEVPATKPGQRTDLSKRVEGTKPAPNPRDPLYFETATTLPVDFHSFRRAFNTALAGAGVNVQHAMHLAGHSDAKTHMRYVMQGPAMRTIPASALPRLPRSAAGIVTARDDWRRAGSKTLTIPARPSGLEPLTRGLEGRCSIQLSYGRRPVQTSALQHPEDAVHVLAQPCRNDLPQRAPVAKHAGGVATLPRPGPAHP